MNNSTMLVSGGAGFIGSHFVKLWAQNNPGANIIVVDKLTYAGNTQYLQGLDITFVQADICDRNVINALFDEYEFDIVINFAAESHVDRSIENPEVFLQTNILGTQTLLEAARKSWISTDSYREGVRFLQVSTDEVYGSLGDEGAFTESTPIAPRSPYAASKAGADHLVHAYCETYKFPACISRCSNNYGPHQYPEKLIPLMVRKIISAQELPVYGDGMNIRDWIYVTDHCEALCLILQQGKNGEVYNIGGETEMRNIDLVKELIRTTRNLVSNSQSKYADINAHQITNTLIRFVQDRKGHDYRYAIDSTKISDELDWKPTVSLPEGLKRTIKWYLDNAEWIFMGESKWKNN